MSKTKTLTSEGEELAGQYEARQQVRAERAQMMSPEQAAQAVTHYTEATRGGELSAAPIDELPPATDNGTKTSSPELAALAAQYINLDELNLEGLSRLDAKTLAADVRALAASVLSQATPK